MPSSLLRRLALALCLAVAALQSAAAQPQASVPILPVSELKAGMKGYGLTVFSGTKVEPFPVTILGVVRNYIAESDLILIRVDGGYPAKHGVGIIAGMSGSPVYVNGRLIGAVAYGWPFSKEPIGGVTPIESMLKDLPRAGRADAPPSQALSPGPRALPSPIRVSSTVLRRVQVVPNSAAASALPRAADTLVLSPVPSLFQVSGFGERAYSGLEKILKPLNMEPVRTFAAAPPSNARMPRVTPGSAVGVQLLTGDLEIAGTGTLTYIDGSRFLAFGHPMAQLGDVNLPMTASYVEGILPSYQRPFKFASQIGSIGQLTSDRLWAVGGSFGPGAPMIPVTIHLSEPGHNLTKTYHLRAIQHRFLTPAIVTQAMMEGLNSMVPAGAESTAVVDYHIKPQGREAIDLQQMTAGATVDSAVAMQFNEYLAQLTNNDFAPLALESVDVHVKILPGKRTATIDRIFTTRSSYRRGEDIDLHVVLHPYGKAPFEQVVRIPVPADIDKGQIMLGVAGGTDMPMLRKRLAQPKLEASSIDQLVDLMVHQERGQQLIVKAAFPSKAAVIGSERFAFLPDGLRDVLPTLPQSDIGVEKDTFEKRVDTEWVVRGAEVINADISLTVEAGDKKKPEAPTRVLAVDVDPQPLAAAGPAPLEKRDDVKPSNEPKKKEADSTATADKVLPSGTRRWDLQDTAAFAQGTFDGTSVSTDGNVSLAPRSERRLLGGGDILLSMAREPHGGRLLAGTASQGRVLQLASGGDAATEWKVGDAAVTALAVGPDGATWIGTGPRGRLYRKSGSGAPRLVFDGPSSYVWAILPQSDGSVVVGTGNPARLLRVAADGASRPLAGFTERHVRAVAASPDGSLIVATAGPGVVYRVRGGQREAQFTTAFASIDALLVRASGEIVAASGRNLYRLPPGGRVRVLTLSDKPLLALADTSRGILAGGGGGRIFAVDDGDAAVRVADFQGGAVTALRADGTDAIAVTAGPGAVVHVGGQIVGEGSWMSEVLDAGGAARWGRVRWMGEGGGTVAIETRSGYTAAPDTTWSPWSAASTSADGSPIGSPPGRYLQVRARLAASGASLPRLTSLSIFFRNEDQQPSVELSRPRGGERLAGTQKVQWKASGAGIDSMAWDLSYSSDGHAWTPIQRGLGPAVKESATPTADPSQAEEYAWDTRKVSDGRYRLRLETYTAAQPEGPRTTTLSKPFIVANTPPELSSITPERLGDGRIRLRGVAHSHLAAVVSVAFKQSGREWQIASPDDGFYDSEKEPFTFVLGGSGEVEIRITDEAGNSRTVKRSF